MTPEEIQLYQQAGNVYALNEIEGTFRSTVYGLYVPFFFAGAYALLHNRHRTKYSWILFGFISFMFALNTMDFILDPIFDVLQLRGGLVDNPDLPVSQRLVAADQRVAVVNLLTAWINGGAGLLLICADVIVAWRAWVIWSERRIVQIILCTMLVINFAAFITTGVLNTTVFFGTTEQVLPISSATVTMAIFGLSMSLATNLLATALIGYKTYYHRKNVKEAFFKSKVSTVLLFLTESGTLYCLLQAVYLGISVAPASQESSVDVAGIFWRFLMAFVSSVYPVIVILIVQRQRSIVDQTTILHPEGASGAEADSKYSPNSDCFFRVPDIETHLAFNANPSLSQSGGGTESLGVGVGLGTVSRDTFGRIGSFQRSPLGSGSATATAKWDVEKGLVGDSEGEERKGDSEMGVRSAP